MRDLLAGIGGDPRRHRLDLALHVGDAGLEDVAVQLVGGDVVAFADDEIGHLDFAGGRRRADDDMGEQRAVDDVGLVLGGELADHFGAAAGIGAVILDDHFDRAAIDAAGVVDRLDRRGGGLLVPAAIGGADAGAVRLEADLDRRRALRLRIADEAGRGDEAGAGGQPLQRRAAGEAGLGENVRSVEVRHCGSPVLVPPGRKIPLERRASLPTPLTPVHSDVCGMALLETSLCSNSNTTINAGGWQAC